MDKIETCIISKLLTICRDVVRTGSTGAFAPVSLKQRMLRTLPEKKFPWSQWKPLKNWLKRVEEGTNYTLFFEEGGKIPILKKTCTRPVSCENPNDAPDSETKLSEELINKLKWE